MTRFPSDLLIFSSAGMDHPGVDPVTDDGSDVREALGLDALRLVVGEGEVPPAAMHLELRTKVGDAHGRALDVPARPPVAPRRGPCRLIGKRPLPEDWIQGIAFPRQLGSVAPLVGQRQALSGRDMGERSPCRVCGRGQVHMVVAHVGEPERKQRLDHGHHLGQVLGGPRIDVWRRASSASAMSARKSLRVPSAKGQVVLANRRGRGRACRHRHRSGSGRTAPPARRTRDTDAITSKVRYVNACPRWVVSYGRDPAHVQSRSDPRRAARPERCRHDGCRTAEEPAAGTGALAQMALESVSHVGSAEMARRLRGGPARDHHRGVVLSGYPEPPRHLLLIDRTAVTTSSSSADRC